MDTKVKNRLKWIKLYEELGDAKEVCQHFGISRFTLRKWSKRYKERGMEGLKNISTRPKNSPLQKRDEINEEIILTLRKERKLGVRRIQSELKRLHEISLSVATIHKVLKKHEVGYLQLKRHYRKQVKRYNCKIPGERVQMDVCKIAQGVYQYTAIDDCTRYKILGIYKRRTSLNTVNFLECVIKHMPFPIQRIQTDRGQEFFAYLVQDYLKEKKIKFRPIKAFSPHLNGKVERSQRTDLDEFYTSINPNASDLPDKLKVWEEYYNKQRSHSA
ncbi:Transposase, partial [Candidatus Jidaibacter acanthamoeba]